MIRPNFVGLVVLTILTAFVKSEEQLDEVLEKGSLTITKADRRVLLALENGGKYEFSSEQTIKPLGMVMPKEDPDMFRAVGKGPNDVIIVRFMQSDGKRVFDEDGLVSMDNKMYTLKQEGEVKDTEETVVTTVKLQHVQVKGHGNDLVPVPPEKVARNIVIQEEKAILAPNDTEHRRKRKTDEEKLWLELGIFVDKGFYDAYVKKYGEGKAENKINTFIETAIVVIESDFKTLRRPVHIFVTRYEIWKEQPDFSHEAKDNGDMIQYLSDFVDSIYGDTEFAGVDHSILVSGYDLKKRGALGLAYLGSMCTTYYGSSIVNNFGLSMGETASHEIAHSFGVGHDGDVKYEFEKECKNGTGSLMGTNHHLNNSANLLFSDCSLKRFDHILMQLDAKNKNCFANSPCKDMNTFDLCTTYAKKNPKYCNWLIPNSYCKPVYAFPTARNGGNCYMKEMCRDTCSPQCVKNKCEDINTFSLCTTYAEKDSKYCNWLIPNSYCKPLNAFPSAQAGGNCYIKEMCRKTCNFCS